MACWNIRPEWRNFHHFSTSRPVLIRTLIWKLNFLWKRCQWNSITFPKLVLELKSVHACPRYTTFLVATPTNSILSMSLKLNYFFILWFFRLNLMIIILKSVHAFPRCKVFLITIPTNLKLLVSLNKWCTKWCLFYESKKQLPSKQLSIGRF